MNDRNAIADAADDPQLTDPGFPLTHLDERIAFIGVPGSGKTYAAKGAVERLVARNARVCVVDPLGVWWGLRANPDGAAAGGLPVVIFGGRHADVPIDEHQGAPVGRVIGGTDIRCIVDLSALGSGAARRRFMTAFCGALFEANKELLHLVLDEADLWSPQKPMRGTELLLGLVEEIVRRGRVAGFIPWLITQRPAVVHKNVLSMMDALVLLRLMSSQDRRAVGLWIEGQADKADEKAVLAALPGLAVGEGFVWAPSHGQLSRVTFPRIATFDSSSPPRRGEAQGSATLAKVDLARIAASLAEQRPTPTGVTRVKSNAESDAKTQASIAPSLAAAGREGYEKGLAAGRAIGAGEIARLRQFLAGYAAIFKRIAESGTLLAARADQCSNGALQASSGNYVRARLVSTERTPDADSIRVEIAEEQGPNDSLRVIRARGGPPAPDARMPPAAASATAPRRRASSAVISTDTEVTAGGRALLRVLVQRAPARLTWGQIATLAGLKARGGYFNTGVRSLRASGSIEEGAGLVWTSLRALEQAGIEPGSAQTAAQVRAMWREKLPAPAPAMLDALAENGPLSIAELSDVLDLQPRGGFWNKGIAVLRNNRLVRIHGGVIQLTAELQ